MKSACHHFLFSGRLVGASERLQISVKLAGSISQLEEVLLKPEDDVAGESAAGVHLPGSTAASPLCTSSPADARTPGRSGQRFRQAPRAPPEPGRSTMVNKQDILPACVRAIAHPRCVCAPAVVFFLAGSPRWFAAG